MVYSEDDFPEFETGNTRTAPIQPSPEEDYPQSLRLIAQENRNPSRRQLAFRRALDWFNAWWPAIFNTALTLLLIAAFIFALCWRER